MARPKNGEERVLGPDRHGRRWRVTFVDAEGERTRVSCESEEEAWEVIKGAKAIVGAAASTIEKAIGAYEVFMRHEKGNKSRSVDATGFRLRCFFDGHLELPVYRLNAALGEKLYGAFLPTTATEGKTIPPVRLKPDGKPYAVDSHRNMLAEAKTFGAWMHDKKYVRANPFADIRGKGRRRHGKNKPILHMDEARTWLAHARQLADAGEIGAVMAMVGILMDMRAEEITLRSVRDVDDGCRVLWTESKTEAGTRRIRIPELLRPYLLRLVLDRRPDEPLFYSSRSASGYFDRAMPRKWADRISKAMKIPTVGAHGLRRTFATLGTAIGETPEALAAVMGHESPTTTRQSYIEPSVSSTAGQDRFLTALKGGKK